MAMPANFNKVSTSLVDDSWHFPFGYGAIMYVRDLMTGDLLQSNKNYAHHFYHWAQNKYQGDGYIFGQYICTYYYGFILTINNMVGAVNPDNATDEQLGYLGAGLAFRAMCYIVLCLWFEGSSVYVGWRLRKCCQVCPSCHQQC